MFSELVESLIIATDLDRNALIERVTDARCEAQVAAERLSRLRRLGDLAALADLGAWAVVERIGRLLFFLRFEKVPSGASAEDVALINRLDEELQRIRMLQRLAAARNLQARIELRVGDRQTARRVSRRGSSRFTGH
jgi:hypothetical protein